MERVWCARVMERKSREQSAGREPVQGTEQGQKKLQLYQPCEGFDF